MFVVLFPGVPTFSSKAGEPDTVPEVVTELPFTGTVIVTLLWMPGVTLAGVNGFAAFCVTPTTTFPLLSCVTVAVGRPTVCVAVLPVRRFCV